MDNHELDFDNARSFYTVEDKKRMAKVNDLEAMIKEFRRRLDDMDDNRVIIIGLLREHELELAELMVEDSGD